MNVKEYKKRLNDEIIDPLIDIRNHDDDCGFCSRQIMMLRKEVIKYIKKASRVKKPTDEKILKLFKKTILKINKINRNTDYCMLESDFGDDLCYLMEDVAFECGLTETNEDISKSWREEW